MERRPGGRSTNSKKKVRKVQSTLDSFVVTSLNKSKPVRPLAPELLRLLRSESIASSFFPTSNTKLVTLHSKTQNNSSHDLPPQSWIITSPRFCQFQHWDTSALFRHLWCVCPTTKDAIVMFGKEVDMPRYQRVYGQGYTYSGRHFPGHDFPSYLREIRETLGQMFPQVVWNSLLINWYCHGDHYMGYHQDNESSIRAGTPIVSLSLGAPRRFHCRPLTTGLCWDGVLADGDLMIMGGQCQETHQHAIRKEKHCPDVRINLTFRSLIHKTW